ncbi:MAG: OmpA family protein [Gammaproteobacteria bacterium]
MKKRKLNKTFLPLLITTALINPVIAADDIADREHASTKETGGFGLGLILGGLLGGPPGAVVGAAGGGWLGHNDTNRTDMIATLDEELIERNELIIKLETELSATETELVNTIHRLSGEQKNAKLDYLKKGLTTTVYFRSADTNLPASNAFRLEQLADLLQEFPNIKVSMEGHTDIRGDAEYNRHLSELRIETVQKLLENAGISSDQIRCEAYGESKAMAMEGDNENYVFDRRVSIHVSLPETS